MNRFVHIAPTDDAYWRSIILFGRNSASFKFALGSTLLEQARRGRARIRLADLAEPFADRVCAALKRADRQGTSQGSRFLDTCRRFNRGEVSRDELVATTAKRGFLNVIDAFHVVGQSEVGRRFFEDDRKGSGSIQLTDDLMALADDPSSASLDHELEARWKLVETAWDLELPARLLAITYEPSSGVLGVEGPGFRRRSVTQCRDALNGYQKGSCFYCFRPIRIDLAAPVAAEVDHFYPHMIQGAIGSDLNLDGIWNLVLACPTCNRGGCGKFGRIPALRYLERLSARNDYLIESHHPLRETLLLQTGASSMQRRTFLQKTDTRAVGLLAPRESDRWQASEELPPRF